MAARAHPARYARSARARIRIARSPFDKRARIVEAVRHAADGLRARDHRAVAGRKIVSLAINRLPAREHPPRRRIEVVPFSSASGPAGFHGARATQVVPRPLVAHPTRLHNTTGSEVVALPIHHLPANQIVSTRIAQIPVRTNLNPRLSHGIACKGPVELKIEINVADNTIDLPRRRALPQTIAPTRI